MYSNTRKWNYFWINEQIDVNIESFVHVIIKRVIGYTDFVLWREQL